MITKLLLVLCLLSFAPVAALPGTRGDICDDINELANAWNDVANFMSENGDEQISDSDFMTLKKSIDDLKEGTYALADALIDLGDATETKLGTDMRKTMARLEQAQNKAQVVEALDRLVDILDKTTDYCDEQPE